MGDLMYDLYKRKDLLYIIKLYQSKWGAIKRDQGLLTCSFADVILHTTEQGLLNDAMQTFNTFMSSQGVKLEYNTTKKILSISSNNHIMIEEIETMFRIGTPQVDQEEKLTYQKVVDAKIQGGRILFRGDSRNPLEVFESGMKPYKIASDNDNVLPIANVSQKNVIALTPYLNTAATFPLNNNKSTWIYMTRIDKGIPIAHHSLKLYKKNTVNTAFYAAEVITHSIDPENIICAIRITRPPTTEKYADIFQIDGSFTIDEIVMNEKSIVKQDHVSLIEFFEYLNVQKEKKTSIPFKLSEFISNSTSALMGDEGIIELSADLIAQDSKEYPKEAIQAWKGLLSNMKSVPQKDDINEVVNKYPQGLNLLNVTELHFLLKSYPSIDDGSFFTLLKQKNDKEISQLTLIMKHSPGNYSLKHSRFEVLSYFMNKENDNSFLTTLLNDYCSVEELDVDNIITLLKICHQRNLPISKDIQKMFFVEILRNDFTVPEYMAELVLGTVLDLKDLMPNIVAQVSGRIGGMIEPLLTEDNIESFCFEIAGLACRYSTVENNLLFESIIKAVGQKSRTYLSRVSNPKMNYEFYDLARATVSPIISAIEQGNIKLVKLWIAAGASLRDEVTINEGKTPLMVAIENGHPQIAMIILSRGRYASGLDIKSSDIDELMADQPNTDVWGIVRERIEVLRLDGLTQPTTHQYKSSQPTAPSTKAEQNKNQSNPGNVTN